MQVQQEKVRGVSKAGLKNVPSSHLGQVDSPSGQVA